MPDRTIDLANYVSAMARNSDSDPIVYPPTTYGLRYEEERAPGKRSVSAALLG